MDLGFYDERDPGDRNLYMAQIGKYRTVRGIYTNGKPCDPNDDKNQEGENSRRNLIDITETLII